MVKNWRLDIPAAVRGRDARDVIAKLRDDGRSSLRLREWRRAIEAAGLGYWLAGRQRVRDHTFKRCIVRLIACGDVATDNSGNYWLAEKSEPGVQSDQVIDSVIDQTEFDVQTEAG